MKKFTQSVTIGINEDGALEIIGQEASVKDIIMMLEWGRHVIMNSNFPQDSMKTSGEPLEG